MIKSARRKIGLSQKQLSYRLGVSQSYISKLENRRIDTVSIGLVLELSSILKICPISVFVYLINCCSKCHLNCQYSLKSK